MECIKSVFKIKKIIRRRKVTHGGAGWKKKQGVISVKSWFARTFTEQGDEHECFRSDQALKGISLFSPWCLRACCHCSRV